MYSIHHMHIQTYVHTYVHLSIPVTFSALLHFLPSAVCCVPGVPTLCVPQWLQEVDQSCHDGVLDLLIPGQLLKQLTGCKWESGVGNGDREGEGHCKQVHRLITTVQYIQMSLTHPHTPSCCTARSRLRSSERAGSTIEALTTPI